jgi:phosphohistidine phosphatase
MDLYLIRHADALPLTEPGLPQDFERPLSEKGNSQVKWLAGWLQQEAIHLEVVFTSPLVRAQQTAEGLLGEASPAPSLRVCEELAPGGKRKALAKILRQWGGQSAALVGHMPDLATFAAWLIGSKNAHLDIAKAGVAVISVEDQPRKGSGTLNLLLTPKWLKA